MGREPSSGRRCGHFLNVAAAVLPDLGTVTADVDSAMADLRGPFGVLRSVCRWFLEWETVRESREIVGLDLLHPYEPLIVMFERGGQFQRESVFIDVSSVGLRLPPIDEYRPCLNLYLWMLRNSIISTSREC